ncbi:hypothetical protein KFE98_09470 [bacterium SCSIO 12741]|nr:hypothetical protein KFE98_09470 [bacterium SCSIO 12741]
MPLKDILKLFPILLLITSCVGGSKRPDVSQIEVDLRWSRLDRELFAKKYSMEEKVPALKVKYGNFFSQYVESILNVGAVNDPLLPSVLKDFVYDSDIQKIYNKTQETLGDLEPEQEELKQAFRYFKHYLPERPIPQVVTYISGFNYAIAASDSTLGIGLDMYLGSDYYYYSQLGYPAYRKRKLNRQFLVKDAVKGWIQSDFEPDPENKTLLNEMVYAGKIFYMLDLLLPETPDSIKIGWTSKQLEWCETNETMLWGHFVNENLLFNIHRNQYQKYLAEGPFTTGFSQEAPSQIGFWMGWKIVRSYMENNSEVTPEELLNTSDPQIILNKSGYKPSL